MIILCYELINMPKQSKIYCSQIVYVSKKRRRCRNTVCSNGKCYKHYQPSFPEYGKCCFCQGECNPCSQSCGRCARNMTMEMLGWK